MPRQPTVRERIREVYADLVMRREDLLREGWRPRAITDAVRNGTLIRLRRDRYALIGLDPAIAKAVRAGGRLCCMSLLRMIGVFVLDEDSFHVHVSPNAGRLPVHAESVRLHWGALASQRGRLHVVSIPDAVLQAVRCQTERAALATLDSVVHHGLMTVRELERLFEQLPARLAVLLKLVDGSAESGSETFMRLILRTLGLRFETQVQIPGVGRVDFLVEGWLIIECDSKAFHEGWERQKRDRERDIAAAMAGYVTIRPIAADIFTASDRVREQIAAIVAALRPVRHAGTRRRGVRNTGAVLRSASNLVTPAPQSARSPEL